LLGLIEEEVRDLCGEKYDPTSGSGYFRAGSAPSSIYVDGRKEEITRPRVRELTEEGTEEIQLKTFKAARNTEEWEEVMMRSVLCGVSCRDQKALSPDHVRGKSASNVSRMWAEKASALVAEINERDLSEHPILALMLDGIRLSDTLCAVTALGIDTQGEKHILGFAIGSEENFEVAKDLVVGLQGRGLQKAAKRLLCVLDGSKALKKAVLHVFPDAKIQRCLIHKERNLRSYLARKHHGTLAGFFSRLRKAQGLEAAKEIFDELEAFLKDKNAEAHQSYLEAGEDLKTVYELEMPSTLNRSFLSTNLIENAFGNLRRHFRRVTRWRDETLMAKRWTASGLIIAQKTFRKIQHYQDLPNLKAALDKVAS
jgi:transposase-like protein